VAATERACAGRSRAVGRTACEHGGALALGRVFDDEQLRRLQAVHARRREVDVRRRLRLDHVLKQWNMRQRTRHVAQMCGGGASAGPHPHAAHACATYSTPYSVAWRCAVLQGAAL
jgi:hypothetical protein